MILLFLFALYLQSIFSELLSINARKLTLSDFRNALRMLVDTVA